MSTTPMRIQVATLGDVGDDESRADGVANQEVTVTALNDGASYACRFWDVQGDASPPTIVQDSTDRKIFRFTPTVSGAIYGIELLVDDAFSGIAVGRRAYAVPDAVSGLYPILFGEQVVPTGSLQNNGANVIASTTANFGGTNWRGLVPRWNQIVEWAKAAVLNALSVSRLHVGRDVATYGYAAAPELVVDEQGNVYSDGFALFRNQTLGVTLRSPDGNYWAVTVNNAGVLVATAVDEPIEQA